MSEYATLKKNQNQLHTACKKANIQSSNTRTASSPVVQMIRKRVYHEQDNLTENDIYYDKEDGQYYKRIAQSGAKDVTVTNTVYKKCQDLLSKYSRRTTILAEATTSDNANTFIQIVASEKSKLHENPNSYTGNVLTYTNGEIFNSDDTKAIRLYAEGNMDHALSLDESLNSLEAYQKFITLPDSNTDSSSASTPLNVLIKATEYDSQDCVQTRYHHDGRVMGNMKAIHQTRRTETSFGGRTGNMTRKDGKGITMSEIGETPIIRKYDLIQATFFWLPKVTNNTNFNALKSFMVNHAVKLKDGGKIRITLTNRNNQGNSNVNQYRFVADKLLADEELKANYNMVRNELSCTYADRLSALGLNTDDGFKHTRTQGDIVVEATSDLVIEATLKSQSATPLNIPIRFIKNTCRQTSLY